MDLILGSRDLREKIVAMKDPAVLETLWQNGLNKFKTHSEKFYLYD